MLPLFNQGSIQEFENKTIRDILRAYQGSTFLGLQVSVLNVNIFVTNILETYHHCH